MFTVTLLMRSPRSRGQGKQKRPTIHDVAQAAGVSHMTVSRALRKSKAVKESTRKRVMEVAGKMGYRPDPALSALAAYRSHGGGKGDGSILAFLDCDGKVFSQQVLAGVREEAMLHGYGVVSHRLPKKAVEQKRLSRMLFHRGVRGLLFGPSDDEWTFQGWDWREHAPVSLGALAHHPTMHAVAMNYFDGAISACRLLAEHGCQKIGLAIHPNLESRTGHRWLGGYAAALGGKALRIYPGPWPVASHFVRWLKSKQVDGLLTIHADVCQRWPGRKERVILLNETESLVCREHSYLSLDPSQIGTEGVRFLHQLLLRREYGLPAESKMVTLQGKWVLRPS